MKKPQVTTYEKKFYSLQIEIVVKNRGRNKTVIKKMIMSQQGIKHEKANKKQGNRKLFC